MATEKNKEVEASGKRERVTVLGVRRSWKAES